MADLPTHSDRHGHHRQPRADKFLDRLLGPRCPRCWQRVFPRDQKRHNKDCD